MHTHKHALAIILSLTLASNALGANPPAFSFGSLSGWDVKTFSGRALTNYDLTQQDGATILHATCNNAASGLIWKHEIDLTRTPMISWRWKIGRLYPGLDPHAKSGDDYPARVYVVTGSILAPWTIRSLVYVWANAPVTASVHDANGTPFYPDPYTDQAEIVVLQQPGPGPGIWVSEQRNLEADLTRAFGHSFDSVNAVAIMSDCDDSHNHGEAWYGDITFQAAN